jgi:transcriptional regulator with XRE-family HTH domain
MSSERSARGQNLKKYRQSRNMTLQQLSDLTGISVGFLSKIERGVGNPTSNTIQKISYALQITANELIGTGTPAEEETGTVLEESGSFIIREDDREVIYGLTNTFKFESIFEGNPHFKVNVMTICQDAAEQVYSIHSYDEFGIVTSGTLSVDLDNGREHYELTAGQCIMIRAQTYHSVKNTAKEPCITYWIEIL